MGDHRLTFRVSRGESAAGRFALDCAVISGSSLPAGTGRTPGSGRESLVIIRDSPLNVAFTAAFRGFGEVCSVTFMPVGAFISGFGVGGGVRRLRT
ncbi:hypothetical protein DAD186_12320 [Dermabacter vaginalis]|uniref:Uncharacterized protein n=1 Tax=Dermabacter vaginalis TaxID=1630135 RepID=A0A1B0ZIW3_9MICO|nr:hypothetical protein DAD186_12320 [Dermabacter vaginalis]